MSEHELQVACVRWFRYQYPQYMIYAIPNGGLRNVRVASKMKAEGVLSGVPDLCVPVPMHGYHSLYIEMKDGSRGSLSTTQKDVIPLLESFGHRCVVVRNFDDFFEVVNEYLRDDRERDL